jgi:hypothetical protein
LFDRDENQLGPVCYTIYTIISPKWLWKRGLARDNVSNTNQQKTDIAAELAG